MAGELSAATSAVSVALDPYSPVAWVGLAKSLGGLFGAFGGGSTPSVLGGFRLQGKASESGFHGSITAFDQLGNTWAATGETAGVAALGSDIWGSSYQKILSPDAFRRALAASPVPVDIKLPPYAAGDTSRLPIQLSQYLAGFLSRGGGVSAAETASTLAAPTIPETSMPPNSPGTVTAGAGGGSLAGGSTVSPAAGAAAPVIQNWIPLILGGVVLWYLFKKVA